MNALEAVGELVLNIIAVAGFWIISITLGGTSWDIPTDIVFGIFVVWVYIKIEPAQAAYSFKSYRPFMNLCGAITAAVFLERAMKESGWAILVPTAITVWWVWFWASAYREAKDSKPSQPS